MTEMLCRDCDAVVEFEVPVCDDVVDEYALMCVVCGAAVTVGGMLLAEPDRTHRAA